MGTMKSGAGFVGTSVCLMVAQMLSNILVIRWLDPHDTGIWQTLMLVQSYAGFAQLGLFSGLNRELPYQLGQDRRARAHLMVATTQAHAMGCALTSLLFSAGVIALFDLEPVWQLAVGTVGLSTAASLYFQFLSVTYRGTNNFYRLSIANGVQALVAVGSIPLVFFWSFEGLCARIILMALGWLALLYAGRPVQVRMSWDWSAVRDLLLAGGPAFGLGYLLTLSYGFDKLLLLEAGGVVAVGLYAPAAAVKVGMAAIPNAVNAYISPRMSRRLGETRDPRALWALTWKAALGTSLLMIPLVVVGWLLIPWGIQVLFPRYEEGIAAAQLLALSGLFVGARASSAVLTSLKAWWELGALNGLTLVCFWSLPWYFSRTSPEGPLYGVSLGWALACAIMMPIGLSLMYFATHKGAAVPDNGPV